MTERERRGKRHVTMFGKGGTELMAILKLVCVRTCASFSRLAFPRAYSIFRGIVLVETRGSGDSCAFAREER